MHLRLPDQIQQLPSQSLRSGGVYLSGALYATSFYLMLNSALFSRHRNTSDLHIGFVDWIPLLLSSLGMLVINLVETSRISAGGAAFGSDYSSDAWSAKIVLFLGFAFLSGGVSGSIIILVLRYIVHNHGGQILGMGIQNVLSSLGVMGSCFVLWMAQNVQDDYSYSLQL